MIQKKQKKKKQEICHFNWWSVVRSDQYINDEWWAFFS